MFRLRQWYGENLWGVLFVFQLDDWCGMGLHCLLCDFPPDVTCVKRTCVACGLPLDQWYEEGQWDLL